MSVKSLAIRVLTLNTLAFTVCFAVWTMYGVLGAFLSDAHIINIDKVQLGWLIGAPILTGSILRLPVGVLADRYGGKPVYIAVMLIAAIGAALTSFASTYNQLLLCGLVFGTSGAAFAVGIAYTSTYFPKERQGTALGIFGVGNAGSAITTLVAPSVLQRLYRGGENPEGWRQLPLYYAAGLVLITVLFALLTVNRKPHEAELKTLAQKLRPLRDVRVWRFGVYYFLVFGAFVALAQWLVPYYLNVYGMSLATAGLMASIFSLPSGLIRALGGWISDKFGARHTMYWVLSLCVLLFSMIIAPRMDIFSPGEGILADRAGIVTSVGSKQVIVDAKSYALIEPKTAQADSNAVASPRSGTSEQALIWPKRENWHEPVVKVGQKVKKKELLARGTTHVYFQANVWVFTAIVFMVGMVMGVGKAAVYRHIPDYFPNDVGVVGGLVGVIGGLGGFFCPILFGYLLKATGLWTSCWLFLAILSIGSLVWMHLVIMRMAHPVPQGSSSEFDS